MQLCSIKNVKVSYINGQKCLDFFPSILFWVAYCIDREVELVLVDYFWLPLYKSRKEAACVVVKLIYV